MDSRAKAYRNYVKERYDGDFGASVLIDDDKKTFFCECTGSETIASFDEIRVISNEFFSQNEIGQSLEGYLVHITFKGGNAGPVLSVLSNESFNEENGTSPEKELCNVTIRGFAGSGYKISQMKGHFESVRYLSLTNVALDSLVVLREIKDLEIIRLEYEYTKDDYELVQEELPNCKVIYDYEE